MTQTTPTHVISTWIQAYNDHDLEAVTALYDPAATNTQWPWVTTKRGRDAVRATFERTFAAFPDIHVVADHLLDTGEFVVLEWTFGGTMQGAFGGHAPTGRRFDLHGCEVFRVRDGRITEQRGYWDKTTMFGQLGLGSPEPA